jgi:hypothetical protein
MLTMKWIGATSVIAGGIVAAITGPLSLVQGSWLAAYLVLVSGVAQFAFGVLPARVSTTEHSTHTGWLLVASWNLGNVGAIAGTLRGVPLLVDLASVVLVIGLGLAIVLVRGPVAEGARLLAWGYRALLLVLLVSIPIGVLLAHTRHGG